MDRSSKKPLFNQVQIIRHNMANFGPRVCFERCHAVVSNELTTAEPQE